MIIYLFQIIFFQFFNYFNLFQIIYYYLFIMPKQQKENIKGEYVKKILK